jgi:hypothetical protein
MMDCNVSLDKGVTWSRFPAKVFPRVSTMDLKIHPTDNSLAIATFGRALWVLDNLSALRQMAIDRKVLDKSYALFPPKEAIQASMRSVDGIRFSASAEFKGDNRQNGAQFPVYVKPAEKKEPPIAVPPSAKDNSKKKEEKSIEPPKPVVAPADSTKKRKEGQG